MLLGISLIICLFLSSSPSAIILKITKIIIFSIDREINRWSWSHIIQKIVNIMAPSFTNGYSSSPISFKGRIVFIMTSISAKILPKMI